MAVVKFRTVSNTVYFKGISDFDNILMFYPAVGGGSTQGFSDYDENYNSNLSKYETIFIIDRITYVDNYGIIVYGIIRPKINSQSYDFIYRQNGVIKTDIISNIYQNFNIDETDIFADSGVSSLSVTADSGINSIMYNSNIYDTFPATIPLDPAATTMQVESKSPVVTINDGGNLKSVTYGSATYTKFPATVTATTPEFAVTARGKDSPVITVRTERTQTPVITNT